MMVLWTSSQLSAQTFEVDGVYYTVLSEDDKTAEVAQYLDRNYESLYTGDIKVLPNVDYEGVTYTVTSLCDAAFAGSSITSIELPNTLKVIGGYAFSGCKLLKVLTIPESVTEMGENSINVSEEGIEKLIMLPTTPPACDSFNFSGIIYVPDGSLSAYKSSSPWDYYPNIVEGDGSKDYVLKFKVDGIYYERENISSDIVAVIEGDEPYSGDIVIPEIVTYDGADYKVESMCSFAYTKITSIEIPSSISIIRSRAFKNCTSLKKVIFNPGVSMIYAQAFEGSDNIESIICLSTTPPECQMYAFSSKVYSNCVLTVPGNAVNAYRRADEWRSFSHIEAGEMTGFTENGIVYSIVSAEDKTVEVVAPAFNAYSGNIQIPAEASGYTVIGIGRNAFNNAKELESVTLPTSIRYIEEGAFQKAVSLTVLELPEGLERIGDRAFWESGITSLVIPSSVSTIGEDFASDELKSLSVAAGNETYSTIGDVLYNKEKTALLYACKSITSIDMPATLKRIESEALCGCIQLTKVVIPDNVISIGYRAFLACSGITSMTLGKSVGNIGEDALYACTALRELTVLAEVPPTFQNCSTYGDKEFDEEVYTYCQLTVPEDSKDAYSNTMPWSKFSKMSEIVVSKIVLTPTELKLLKGETGKLTAAVTPEDLEDKTITWKSDKPEVAEVADGVVTAKGKGEATITATLSTGASATCKVIVELHPDAISLDLYELNLAIGSSKTLKATITSDENPEQAITWTSSAPEVASVKDGVVTGKQLGTAVITASLANGAKAECAVTVTEKVVPTEKIEIIASNAPISAKTLKKGETLQLTAKTTPEDATDKITWSSDNKEVATVDETGLVTTVGVGKTEIKATAGEKSATCVITVVSPAETLTISVGETEPLNKGDKLNIKATIEPEDCTDEIEWSVEGESVTIVPSEDGKSCEVTAVSAGEATVTVKAGEKSASCKITVKVPMTGIELDKTEAEGYIGGTVQLTATVKPEDTTDDTTVTWTSSDEEVATVDENGLVSCLAEGEAVIIATCGEFSAECTVTVTDRPPFVAITSLELSESEIELALNFTYSLFAIIAPENATDTELEWSSSDINVARVYEGVVYGIVPGEAVITAKTTDGSNLSASCKVTIVETSGIDGTEGDGVKVTAAAGVVTVKGAAAGSTVEVYSMSGACVAAKTVESSVEEFPVAASGIYVVRAGGKTFKVAL